MRKDGMVAIYAVVVNGLPNHIFYVGSAVDPEKRFSDHKKGRDRGRVRTWFLNNADQVYMRVIEWVPANKRDHAEAYWHTQCNRLFIAGYPRILGRIPVKEFHWETDVKFEPIELAKRELDLIESGKADLDFVEEREKISGSLKTSGFAGRNGRVSLEDW